jgi:DNA-binding transcriptional LysR family regulator
MRRPKVKLNSLVAFLVVAEKRDINDAANEMGLSASTIRKQLDAIEKYFWYSAA